MSESAVLDQAIKPTKETYEAFQHAYERLNSALFGGELPNCLITLQRRKRSYGYFSGDRFGREDGRAADEIALNPEHFRERPVADVLATLAHEMVHLWQHHFGKPGRGRYHNKEWAAKMKAIGLAPTDTGAPGGKETGDHVSHIIVPDGRFDKAVRKLTERGYALTWTENPSPVRASKAKEGEEGGESKSGKRIKYLCAHPDCEEKLWGRGGQEPLCQGHADTGKHEPAMMEPAE